MIFLTDGPEGRGMSLEEMAQAGKLGNAWVLGQQEPYARGGCDLTLGPDFRYHEYPQVLHQRGLRKIAMLLISREEAEFHWSHSAGKSLQVGLFCKISQK